ncbi:citrate lyase beta subunit [Thelephora terrestris]|uniref:Citrate lyase beta subunit n=1 Tax=Thelephora terrestris TaxID=56493 RepID=A0A9P6H6N0_9AGAM|nr:citrate lyase beta subunit [Thelephora terrestris]
MLLRFIATKTHRRISFCEGPRTNGCRKWLSTTSKRSLRRSYLYVPASSDRMLRKSLETPSDIIIYDLEDSVSPTRTDKDAARDRLLNFLSTTEKLPAPERIAVRLNSVNTEHFVEDIRCVMSIPAVATIVMPKVDHEDHLGHVEQEISRVIHSNPGFRTQRPETLSVVASIESAQALWRIGEISQWKSKTARLSALLFAAEDYCADTRIARTKSRQELLYTRSKIVATARAFGLDAIHMVCVDYKNLDVLADECADGRRLGFDGKQAIHPNQVDTIHTTFVPSPAEIMRAAQILKAMESAHSSHKGAVGLFVNGRDEMIDAPMLRQVRVFARPPPEMIKANSVAKIGPANHSTRKASRTTHRAL